MTKPATGKRLSPSQWEYLKRLPQALVYIASRSADDATRGDLRDAARRIALRFDIHAPVESDEDDLFGL